MNIVYLDMNKFYGLHTLQTGTKSNRYIYIHQGEPHYKNENLVHHSFFFHMKFVTYFTNFIPSFTCLWIGIFTIW